MRTNLPSPAFASRGGFHPGAGIFFERRAGADRRIPASFPPSFSSHRRRRSGGRRRTDGGAYVDIYDWRTWAVAIAVLALSFCDAIVTGLQVHWGGAEEANPVMAKAMEWGGMYGFYAVKAVMTAFPLAIIMMHKEWALGRLAARFCLWCYILVSSYHIYLIEVHKTLGS